MNRRLLLCLLLAIAAAPAQDNAAGPPEEFRKAYALAGEQRYEESLAILDQVLERVEHARNGLFSAGNIAIQAGQFERARGYLERLKELEPNAGQVRSLLVQAYQALGRKDSRDRERSELLRLRSSGADPELQKTAMFMRDEFSVGEARVRVLEFFELEGDRPVRYGFFVSAPGRTEPAYRRLVGDHEAKAESRRQALSLGRLPGKRWTCHARHVLARTGLRSNPRTRDDLRRPEPTEEGIGDRRTNLEN